jgi:hypothetical protein
VYSLKVKSSLLERAASARVVAAAPVFGCLYDGTPGQLVDANPGIQQDSFVDVVLDGGTTVALAHEF